MRVTDQGQAGEVEKEQFETSEDNQERKKSWKLKEETDLRGDEWQKARGL